MRMKKLELQDINSQIHTYNLQRELDEPRETWKGRNNIDKADMEVLLSVINPNRRGGCLDILTVLLPIFLRRWRMELKKGSDDEREGKRIKAVKELLNLSTYDWKDIRVKVMWKDKAIMESDPETLIRRITKEKSWLETVDWKIIKAKGKETITLLDTFPKEKK